MLRSLISNSFLRRSRSAHIIGNFNGILKPTVSGLLIRPVTTHVEKVEEIYDKLYKQVDVEVRGHDPAVLKSYSQFVTMAANELSIEMGKCLIPRKAHHDRLTLLRSIHVNKKCRVQYETRTYFGYMQFYKLTGSTSDTFLEYIQRNLPEGVSMIVTKVGLEKVPEYLKPPEQIENEIKTVF